MDIDDSLTPNEFDDFLHGILNTTNTNNAASLNPSPQTTTAKSTTITIYPDFDNDEFDIDDVSGSFDGILPGKNIEKKKWKW